ncbi:hypothetical protein R50345_30500 [Paenibacillus sp. FSL R5-0345]|uniref:hypothetical protein n=1 Tax=Paenibacillus sp. FSL R5-0345 TaxID=1536770 RepID=UPI0004F6B077|nr:hypothetical protein [Paenibacillus sp. FSL R5-0345]AIQ38565.1 hypothetical protein R50345_30500 [Paenibacillus sp. FSL R5-0345]
MDKEQQQRILDFLKISFNSDDTIHILAVAAMEHEKLERHQPLILKLRVALTFHEDQSINPYFDGTDMYVLLTPTEIQFAREEEWADGPPIMEGSPIELALGWVSQLNVPFYVSTEAHEAAHKERG